MNRKHALVLNLALVCLASAPQLTFAQTTLQKTTHGYIDSQAKLARQGQEIATRNAVVAILQSAGINPSVARAFGFQERVVQAQLAYSHGAQVGIHEADIVNALNNVENELNTPKWSKTDAEEVRRVRVLDIMLYPNLLLSHKPVASGETPHLLDDTMGLWRRCASRFRL